MASLLNLVGQLIDLRDDGLFTEMSATCSPLYTFLLSREIFTPIFFKITMTPVLVGFTCLNRSSVWFLDFFALIIVFPSALIPPKITLLLHCAEPLSSKNEIDFNFCDPLTIRGKL